MGNLPTENKVVEVGPRSAVRQLQQKIFLLIKVQQDRQHCLEGSQVWGKNRHGHINCQDINAVEPVYYCMLVYAWQQTSIYNML